MTITKADLAQKVANDCGFMKGEATEIVEKLLKVIKASLINGEDVMVSGFGKWSVKDKESEARKESANRRRVGSGCEAGGDMALFACADEGDQRNPQSLARPKPTETTEPPQKSKRGRALRVGLT